MSGLERRQGWYPLLPELIDWMEAGVPGRRTPGMHDIRVEEQITEDGYVLRAELPGMDPEKDIHISTSGEVLVIRAEREERTEHKGHSEFRYGSFARSMRLPEGARGDEATASYANGVLEVTVPLAEAKPESRSIPVQRG
ncbi:Hsp20/alpha crystallin family protein [Streptomyces sp. ODS28]|uniref:Hsp20/alpha crystallin family protein n=1 Tax=Streptomyces sp. ODS28 TaxID=3136688 RepID=UPI0031EDCC94